MSEGTEVGWVVTHRREKFKKNQKKVASKNHQEICGGTLNNIIQKGRYTAGTYKASTFR